MIKDTLYAKYIKEREDQDVIENETGFITYLITEKECFISNMFIDESIRIQGKGRELINEIAGIALEKGCEYLSAAVRMNDKNCSKTLSAALAVGFQVVKADHGSVVIIKNITGSV